MQSLQIQRPHGHTSTGTRPEPQSQVLRHFDRNEMSDPRLGGIGPVSGLGLRRLVCGLRRGVLFSCRPTFCL